MTGKLARIILAFSGHQALPATSQAVSEEQERDERLQWMDDRGFRLVLDHLRGGYDAGFNRNAEYQFMRAEWEEPIVTRLADLHPMANMFGGLRYRP